MLIPQGDNLRKQQFAGGTSEKWHLRVPRREIMMQLLMVLVVLFGLLVEVVEGQTAVSYPSSTATSPASAAAAPAPAYAPPGSSGGYTQPEHHFLEYTGGSYSVSTYAPGGGGLRKRWQGPSFRTGGSGPKADEITERGLEMAEELNDAHKAAYEKDSDEIFKGYFASLKPVVKEVVVDRPVYIDRPVHVPVPVPGPTVYVTPPTWLPGFYWVMPGRCCYGGGRYWHWGASGWYCY